MLNNITKVLFLEVFDIYKAIEFDIILNQIETIENFIIIFISIPIKYKYIDIGKNPIKKENVNIRLFPKSFPANISNIDILYDKIKSKIPASFSDNIES